MTSSGDVAILWVRNENINHIGMTMTENRVIRNLIEFFREEFANDPATVADWIAQGGDDFEEFFAAVQSLDKKLFKDDESSK